MEFEDEVLVELELPPDVVVCVWVLGLGLVLVMALEPVIAFDPVMAFEPDIELDDDMVLPLAGAFAAACANAAPLKAMQTTTTGARIFTERIIASL